MGQITRNERNKEAMLSKRWNNVWSLYFFSLLVGLFALLPRLDSFEYFHGKYLWAEDGNIFLNQSKDLGINAILTPYAGYLHVYPRLIAGIAHFFELTYQPVVLLAGWFIAYFILIHSLLKSIYTQEHRIISLVLLVALAALQPNYGEVYFNITNSQWFLGAALFLYTISDDSKEKPSWIRGKFLFIFALTGPFSVLLAPILVIKIIIKKDWKDFKSTYFVVFLGAFIQLLVLLPSDRVSSGVISKDPWEWIISFLSIISFGASNVPTLLSALVIWVLVIYLIFSNIYKTGKFETVVQTELLLLISACLLVAAGLFSHKHSPSAVIALGGGNRYTWAPYVLVLTSIILLFGKQQIIGGVVIFLFGFICYANFHKVHFSNLQFYSFANFSKVDDVVIPIQPQWPIYPGWHIAAARSPAQPPPLPIEITLTPESFLYSGLNANFVDKKLEVVSTDGDPALILDNKVPCVLHSHVGVNIYLTRKSEGWMQLFWGANKVFNETNSLRRWYPSGDVKAQFAFPLNGDSTYIRIDPMEHVGAAVLKKIELYCLR